MRGTFEEEEVHNIFKPDIETKKRDKGSRSEEEQRLSLIGTFFAATKKRSVWPD